METLLWTFAVCATIAAVAGGDSSQENRTLVLKSGEDEATIHFHGATVISWKVGGEERLFLSGASKLDGSSHIMGGIPIVFPKFADWGESRPFHGFARISKWSPLEVKENEVTFELKDSEVTRGWWNHTFRLLYNVKLELQQLVSSLTVFNPADGEAFDFEVLYHTFLRVPDVRNVTISGLKGLRYKDKTRNFDEFTEDREEVVIDKFTDSVYKETPDVHKIGGLDNRTLELKKSGLPDLVVWNPWSEVIKTFTDLLPNEWTEYVCAEAGHVTSKIHLPPGGKYKAIQTLTLV